MYFNLGGNQRELARAKNLKKQQDGKSKNDDGLTPQRRRERYRKNYFDILLNSTSRNVLFPLPEMPKR